MNLRKIKCSRCGRLAELANSQSKQKDGLVTLYCYNPEHKRMKIKVIGGQNMPRVIRSNRMKTPMKDDNYHLQRLKCVLCGKKLSFDKKGSYQSGGKVQGYCFNNRLHRLKIKIYSKLMNEPDFDELQEIIIKQSDL